MPNQDRAATLEEHNDAQMDAGSSAKIGDRLKRVRTDSGLTQADLARRLGVSLRAYQTYERAERELPFPVALRLCIEFQINPLWLSVYDNSASRHLISLDEYVSLSGDLYDTWQRSINTLNKPVPPEMQKVLYRQLSRSTFRDRRVPVSEISDLLRDLN